MRRVTAYKAQPVGSSTPEAVTILIKDEFPNLADADASDAAMNIDAAAVAGALWNSLPGGTLDPVVRRVNAPPGFPPARRPPHPGR